MNTATRLLYATPDCIYCTPTTGQTSLLAIVSLHLQLYCFGNGLDGQATTTWGIFLWHIFYHSSLTAFLDDPHPSFSTRFPTPRLKTLIVLTVGVVVFAHGYLGQSGILLH